MLVNATIEEAAPPTCIRPAVMTSNRKRKGDISLEDAGIFLALPYPSVKPKA